MNTVRQVQEFPMGRSKHGWYVEIVDAVRCARCPEAIPPGTAIQLGKNYYHLDCWVGDWP